MRYMVEKNYFGDKIYIDYTKLKGFEFKPRNKIKYDGIKVDSLTIIKKSFVEKLLKKKVKRKLDFYLEYIINNMNDDDNETAGGLNEVLNDVARYKAIIEYKYRKFLEEEYINLLLKKVNIIERELKLKLLYKQEMMYEMEDTRGKSR